MLQLLCLFCVSWLIKRDYDGFISKFLPKRHSINVNLIEVSLLFLAQMGWSRKLWCFLHNLTYPRSFEAKESRETKWRIVTTLSNLYKKLKLSDMVHLFPSIHHLLIKWLSAVSTFFFHGLCIKSCLLMKTSLYHYFITMNKVILMIVWTSLCISASFGGNKPLQNSKIFLI